MRRWSFPLAGAKYLLAGALAAGAFVATSHTASADGAAARAAPTAQAPTSWSGLYFGVHSGWQWSTDINVRNPAFPPGITVDHDSAVVGGQIGLQHQFGQIVLGIEGNLTTTYQNNPGDAPCPAFGSTCSARLDDILSVGPRLGFAMGHWMPYLTAGYANAAYHFIARTNGTQVQTEEARGRVNGWYIGGGVDMALSHGWTLGVEYRHYDFNDKTVAGFSPAGTFLEPVQFVDPSAEVFTVRVSWKLGRPEPVRPLK
jgi:opacity protein-like surface antigen